ncbi:MAG: DUF5411 family protein [bacterium]|nr:DUF5411 family protein [bacterium]
MKESIWGYMIITLGIIAIFVIWFMGNITRTDQHNYNLLKETTEAAMLDAVDLSAYKADGTVKMNEEKFVENFVRRFADNADLSNIYKIEIFDVNETPPKVSLRVSSSSTTTITNEIIKFNLVNNIDAILEAKYDSLPSNDEFDEERPYDCTSDNHCKVSMLMSSIAGANPNAVENFQKTWFIYLQSLNYENITDMNNIRQNKNVNKSLELKYSNISVGEMNDISKDMIRAYHESSCLWYKYWESDDGKEHNFTTCTEERNVDESTIASSEEKIEKVNIINKTILYEPEKKRIRLLVQYSKSIGEGNIGTQFRINFDYWYE